MRTIVGGTLAVCICLAAIWLNANAPSVQRFTYSNVEEIA